MTTDMEHPVDGRNASHPGDPVVSGPALYASLLQVVTGLWYEIDHVGGVAAAGYFTPDATLRFSNAEFRGTAQIEEVYAARLERGPRVSRHLATNLHILETAPGWARAISTLLLFGEDGEAPRPNTAPALVADVIDEFELTSQGWLIASRWIRNTFIAPATRLAVPQE